MKSILAVVSLTNFYTLLRSIILKTMNTVFASLLTQMVYWYRVLYCNIFIFSFIEVCIEYFELTLDKRCHYQLFVNK